MRRPKSAPSRPAAADRELHALLAGLEADVDPALFARVQQAVLRMENATAAYFLAEQARVIDEVAEAFPGFAPAIRLVAAQLATSDADA
jgi:hypothetical protein